MARAQEGRVERERERERVKRGKRRAYRSKTKNDSWQSNDRIRDS